MNAQQLKNSILQEAIEGRLVPQDPNDEPASVLLEKIRKEKARLVKEGNLKKKDLVEIPISEEEKPFIIPENWEWCKLGNVSEIARGGSPRPIKDYLTEDPNGLNWIKIGDTDKGGKYINSCREKIKPEGLKKTRVVHPGDFLLTNSMSFGRPYITNIEGCIHDGWLMISPYVGTFDQSYLYYVLSSSFSQKQFCDKVAGAVVQNLNSDKVADSLIPLPPLEEQHRIVAKIEELLPKVEECGKAQETLDKMNEDLPERLKKSILQEAIEGRLVPQDPNDEPASVLLEKIRKEKVRLVKEGKLKKKDLVEIPISEKEKKFEVPKSWEWCSLGNIITLLSGRDLTPQDYNSLNDGIPYITGASNFEGETLIINRWTPKPVAISHYGDLLVTCKGSIGTMCFNKIGDIHIARQVMAISPYIVNVNYIKYFLMRIVYELEKKAKSIIPGISREDILTASIPLPPLGEQERIVAKIDNLLKEIDKLKV